MATVGTSTQADLLSWPTVPAVALDSATGYLYAAIRTAADTLTIYRSTNAGASWASFSAMSHTGLQEWSGLVLDFAGWLHLAYRIGTGTNDVIYYRRLDLNTAAWTAAVNASGIDTNGGSIGSVWQGVDLAVVRNPDRTYAIAVCGGYSLGSSYYGLVVMGISIRADGLIYQNNGIITGNRFYYTQGTAPGRTGVACEVQHRGDGFSADVPHLWVAWGRTTLSMVKLAWQGTSVGWGGPANSQIIRSGIPAQDYVGGRWDGSRWLMSTINPDNTSTVRVYERGAANTSTTAYDTLTHPAGVIRSQAVDYDSSGNIRVYAVGTSSALLYYCDYSRGTGIWTAWATVTATAVLGTVPAEWSVRRGGTSGNARHDVLTAASGSPNVVTHTALAVNLVPSIPTWVTAAAYYNGGPANVNAALLLAWTFADPDPGQTQGSYALSRQVGAGTVQYWRASDQTWQASEVQNTSSTSSVTLASGWAAGADAQYAYKVKVWDSTGTPSVGYSAPLVLIPSVPVDPTVTAPTAAQVINTDTVTVTWTVAEQRGYRIVLNTNPATVAAWDSGWVNSTVTSVTVPYRLGNGTAWTVTLQTLNNELLPSSTISRNFSVTYAPPPVPYSTLTTQPTLGYIRVVSAALTAVGVQPAISSLALWRRPVATPTLNSNPTFSGNSTGYATGGTGGGTLTYSTTQTAPYSTPGSARYVPSGASSAPTVEASTVVIDPTLTYYASGWVRPDTANKTITLSVNWYTSASVYISSQTVQLTAPVAAAWQFLEVVADPTSVPNAARASVSLGLTGTPAAGDAIYVDELRLRAYDTSTGVRVAAGATHPATVNDWGAAGSTDYEYRWVATGSNGTSVSGPWIN